MWTFVEQCRLIDHSKIGTNAFSGKIDMQFYSFVETSLAEISMNCICILAIYRFSTKCPYLTHTEFLKKLDFKLTYSLNEAFSNRSPGKLRSRQWFQ